MVDPVRMPWKQLAKLMPRQIEFNFEPFRFPCWGGHAWLGQWMHVYGNDRSGCLEMRGSMEKSVLMFHAYAIIFHAHAIIFCAYAIIFHAYAIIFCVCAIIFCAIIFHACAIIFCVCVMIFCAKCRQWLKRTRKVSVEASNVRWLKHALQSFALFC